MNEPPCVRAAIDAIDDANRADPTIVTVRGRTGPKEILHAELATEWVERLHPDPDDELRIAARGHHLRRWTSPRASAPTGRAGYLKWRKRLHEQHARELGEILTTAGCDAATIDRVQALVRKDGLGRPDVDPAVQVLEDALCLVFLETQLLDVAARLEPDKLSSVVAKTARKMSDEGRAHIADVPLEPGTRRILESALAREVVERYLAALPAADETAIAATLAPDIERIGPYGDVYRGRETYAAFLAATISALPNYVLAVERLIADGVVVAVELSETLDFEGRRRHTDETVVFDVADGLITKVAVYLQKSVIQD